MHKTFILSILLEKFIMNFHEITLDHAAGTTPADGIRVLTLNRSDVMNAMNMRMFTELRDALRWL